MTPTSEQKKTHMKIKPILGGLTLLLSVLLIINLSAAFPQATLAVIMILLATAFMLSIFGLGYILTKEFWP